MKKKEEQVMENNREEFLEKNGEHGKKQSRTRTPLYFTRPKNAGAALLFAALAFLNALPLKADIAGFNTNGVNFVDFGRWYLDEGNSIELACFRVVQRSVGLLVDEAAHFPFESPNALRLLADSSSSDKVAKFSGNEANWHQKPLLAYNDPADLRNSYLPYHRTQRTPAASPAIAFADGMWGSFEPGLDQSGYFGFRFDLNGDGDAAIDQFQYGWARISFSEIVDTPEYDSLSITLHEWAWGGIDETDFRIGQIPEPSTLGLMVTAGLAMYLAGRQKKRRG